MMQMWGRWIAVALVAAGLGVAGLEAYTGVVAKRRAAAAGVLSGRAPGAIEPEQPIAAGIGQTELSAMPRLTD
jgi:hypothetical protein